MVANLGPGFDILGCTMDGINHTVSVRFGSKCSPKQDIYLRYFASTANVNKLSKNPIENCVRIAAIEAMKKLSKNPSQGYLTVFGVAVSSCISPHHDNASCGIGLTYQMIENLNSHKHVHDMELRPLSGISDHDGEKSVFSEDRVFDEPNWGTFDTNDDMDSVWGFNASSISKE
ncbi:homoserine kinase, partial [Trifolium pratense]